MKYEIKLGAELGWAVGTALVVVLAEALLTFDAESVMSDPRAWGVALVTSAFRSAGAVVLNSLRKGS